MYYCKQCGEECNVIELDVGIGRYEYWGTTGVDKRMVYCSDCCESDIVDEDGYYMEISAKDIEEIY